MASPAKWTFMVYLGGDNNLSDAGERDLGEMAAVGSTPEVNIVAQFDRIGGDHRTKRYYVREDELLKVADLGETDCGDPRTLYGFIKWAAENYPAQRYALVLWNHGGGWDPSFIDDNIITQEVITVDYGRVEGLQHFTSLLSHPFFRSTLKIVMSLYDPAERVMVSDGSGLWLDTIELGKVLAEATKLLGQKIDLLGMDACLMSNLEVAYQARRYVNYIVASEEIEPNDGWPYTAVLRRLVDEPDMATAGFAAHIVDAYIKSYDHTDFTVTQAAMDLSKAEELAAVLDELADALLAHMPTAMYEIWNASRKSAASFRHLTLWDISDFCERLEEGTADAIVKTAAGKVRETLELGGFVVAEGHRGEKVERCGGVTVYLEPPRYGFGGISRYYADLDYAADHRWDEMLEAYHAEL